ncbi:MAG TPA: hypothetical protein VGO80_12190 [Solirubrobacteraceae bacterium]|nr:hypothetical protein [Solirubrobacteraceae bacterium]
MTAKQRVVLAALREVQHEHDGEAVSAGQIAAVCAAPWQRRADLVTQALVLLERDGLVLVAAGSARAWRITAAGRLMLAPRRGPARQRPVIGGPRSRKAAATACPRAGRCPGAPTAARPDEFAGGRARTPLEARHRQGSPTVAVQYVAVVNDEMVFAIDGRHATAAQPITMAEAGIREREHLQEWVLANPRILGPGVLIVTSEFDRWESKTGTEKDRLDILGIDTTGRLVVAELKRDAAPQTVEMQAIKYAAMASRFDIDVLADAHAAFARKTASGPDTSAEAAELLESHTEYRLSPETLRTPRIVLIAGSFPATVTATTVWLTEMGLDITLIRVQAYRTSGDVVVTVSQHYPPPDVEAFTVAPTRAARRPKSGDAPPEISWTADDYARAAEIMVNPTALAALDLCSERPDTWVPFEEVIVASGREAAQARGDTGGLTFWLRKHFGRSNAPYETQWAAGGKPQSYYRMTAVQAEMCKAAKASFAADSASHLLQGPQPPTEQDASTPL